MDNRHQPISQCSGHVVDVTHSEHVQLSEADYRTIEAALISSSKGRGFLREFLDRNRTPETERLFRSIARLHRSTVGDPAFISGTRRDLETVLRATRDIRTAITEDNAEAAASSLACVEAIVLALSETMEERNTDPSDGGATSSGSTGNSVHPHAKLYDELAFLYPTAIDPTAKPSDLDLLF